MSPSTFADGSAPTTSSLSGPTTCGPHARCLTLRGHGHPCTAYGHARLASGVTAPVVAGGICTLGSFTKFQALPPSSSTRSSWRTATRRSSRGVPRARRQPRVPTPSTTRAFSSSLLEPAHHHHHHPGRWSTPTRSRWHGSIGRRLDDLRSGRQASVMTPFFGAPCRVLPWRLDTPGVARRSHRTGAPGRLEIAPRTQRWRSLRKLWESVSAI